jgi:ABC-type multidrug transport system permease subunit
MTLTANGWMLWALMRRAINEIVRVPGAAIPGVISPAIFLLGLSAVFGNLRELGGFPSTDSYMTFIIGVSLLQAAGFTGAATGVNLARDLELGWFDRLLVSPAPRWVLLSGTALSASMRALLPMTFVLVVGFALGVSWPGLDGLVLTYLLAGAFAAITAMWTMSVALKVRTQAAGPLMQSGNFMATLFTTSYVPQDLLTGWLATVAPYNPVTYILEGIRQGFVGGVNWTDTWPALVSVAGLSTVFALLALRGLRRATG